MTCSDPPVPGQGPTDQTNEAELVAQGWSRCFVADEPRLSEAVATYRELGFEVRLLPVPLTDGACTECMRQHPDRFRLIFVRKPGENENRSSMHLLVNGEVREVREGLTIAALLEEEGEPAGHVLVEVNGEYFPLPRHASKILEEGDRVEIILPAFGG
jgi:sulfur carrier protein